MRQRAVAEMSPETLFKFVQSARFREPETPFTLKLYPTGRDFVAFREEEPEILIYLTAPFTKDELSRLERLGVSVDFPYGTGATKLPLRKALWKDLWDKEGRHRRRAAAASILLVTLTAWLGQAPRDFIQGATTAVLTLAGLYLAVFAFYSGAAHTLVSADGGPARRLVGSITSGDRVLLGWTLTSILLSFAGYCGAALTPDNSGLLFLVPGTIAALGAAALAVPLSDTVPYLVERQDALQGLLLAQTDAERTLAELDDEEGDDGDDSDSPAG